MPYRQGFLLIPFHYQMNDKNISLLKPLRKAGKRHDEGKLFKHHR
jgi:hypothetical protein